MGDVPTENAPFNTELDIEPATKKLLNKRKFKTVDYDFGAMPAPDQPVSQSQFEVLKCHIESLRRETCQKIELLENRLETTSQLFSNVPDRDAQVTSPNPAEFNGMATMASQKPVEAPWKEDCFFQNTF